MYVEKIIRGESYESYRCINSNNKCTTSRVK
nr:MAG TPA: hypothetical protein [Caudoviricetes sp.]